MNELPYMPVVVSEEMAETAELTNEELGALTRIKWALWKSGGYLPDDGKRLARIARAGSRWGKIAPAVRALLTIVGGQVSSASVLKTLLITRERRARSVKAVSARFAKPEPGLTSSNPLKSHDAGAVYVPFEHDQSKSKLKNIAESSLRSSDAAARGNAAGLSRKEVDPGSVEATQHEVLYVHGAELLVTRVGLQLLRARAQISRWLMQIDPDPLARILADADLHNLQGPNFVAVVDKRVAAIAAEKLFGGSLRFPPASIRKADGNG